MLEAEALRFQDPITRMVYSTTTLVSVHISPLSKFLHLHHSRCVNAVCIYVGLFII
jgi:hypothetical protein